MRTVMAKAGSVNIIETRLGLERRWCVRTVMAKAGSVNIIETCLGLEVENVAVERVCLVAATMQTLQGILE